MTGKQTLWERLKDGALWVFCLLVFIGLMSDGFGLGLISYVGDEGWIIWVMLAWVVLCVPYIAFLGARLLVRKIKNR